MRECWVTYNNRRYHLRRGETTIGRSPYCSIVLEGKQASRQHAALLFTEGKLEIQDLKSRNGTLVNGQPVKAVCRLNIGDTITIGDEVMTITAEAPRRGSAERTVDNPHATTQPGAPQNTIAPEPTWSGSARDPEHKS